jgi:NAD(P)-dependent dehydrogenase (short-subunit alcohol dehydrogenase family)
MDDVDQAKGTYNDADIVGRVPMGRFASADDVARAIAFLADATESAFVNGHTLVVDGGWTADASWESLRLSHR